MYGWSPDDKAEWKNPDAYSFKEAKKPYLEAVASDAKAKGVLDESSRIYQSKKTPNLDLVDPKKVNLTTASQNPVYFLIDGTGSMQDWPAQIFDRLPLVYSTLVNYRTDVEIGFGVVGDAKYDNWPVQLSPFGKGVTLEDYLKGLKAEGGGGPGHRESYELAAYALNQKATMPNATSPILVLMGDEAFYQTISKVEITKFLGLPTQLDVAAKDMWLSLTSKFDTYLVKKSHASDNIIVPEWQAAIGAQKIIYCTDPERVVDHALGAIAKRWGELGDFQNNLSARQDKSKVLEVLASLKAAPGANPEELGGELKSKMGASQAALKSKSLIG